ncbi:LOW QUALITY PROTEIN: hypothetical protein PHMEG_0004932 [Phytophthora megakarya]|uniref:Reverse transcriptase domain-containing protein n=1 Tax=Phytophthora megakarya TaxID=4795 RepID=A0A225WUN9_9STRA|nr:LOW QUALITY PROTEIN: hypothetical protein PHMEG_0004932 [Phytophthora megakarya]
MSYFLDNGTTHNVIPRCIVDELEMLDSKVKIKRLDPPVEGKAVGGACIKCTEAVDLDIGLQTVTGRVNVRGVSCIIAESDEGEFLLGQQTLKSLGVDVDELLAGLVTQGISDVDPFDDERDYQPIARPDTAAIKARLCEMVDEAVENGFPVDKSDELNAGVSKRDIWRLEFNEKLIKLGWAYKNPDSHWACPALPVRKPGKENERKQTIDFRPVNALTQALAGGMTNNETHLEDGRGTKHKQTADFIKSFFQLALAPESQECQPYMTGDGEIITPTRLQQGSVDSSLQFQQSIEKVMREKDLLFKNVLVWVDDLLIYASTIDEFLTVIDSIYSLLEKYGLFLDMDKTCLYTSNAKWCGRALTEDGVTYDPSKIQALVEMPSPTTAGDLQQFLCAAEWMRSSLVDFARVCQPLQDRLDKELALTRRTKLQYHFALTSEELHSFNEVKNLLWSAATLALPDSDATICMYSDTSDEGWSIIITMVKEWCKTTPAADQQHGLLYCMSGTFRDASRNWSVIEKEGYPIVRACSEQDYLLIRDK